MKAKFLALIAVGSNPEASWKSGMSKVVGELISDISELKREFLALIALASNPEVGWIGLAVIIFLLFLFWDNITGSIKASDTMAEVENPKEIGESGQESQESQEDQEGQCSQGTGFLVGSEGHIITNFHVIEEATESITVYFPHGGKYFASIVSKDHINDLAILKLDEYASKAYNSNLIIGDSTKAKIGDKVFTIGYPSIELMGEQPKYTEGTISSIAGFNDDPRQFQISVPIQGGSSGGPLLNSQGEVIGVTNASLNVRRDEYGEVCDTFQNVSYAIKSSLLNNLIQLLPEEALPQTTNNLGNDHSEIIDSIKPNIVFIEAE